MIGNGVERHEGKSARSPRLNDEDGDQNAQTGQDAQTGYGPPRPLDGIANQVRELVEYANQYIEARKDMVRATVRGLIWKAILGITAGIAGVTLIIVAAVYLMSGIAHGLGALFGERYWLGELVTAAAFFLILAIAAYVGMKLLTKSARERTVKKYERRQQEQRQRFGYSATERAQQLRQTQRG